MDDRIHAVERFIMKLALFFTLLVPSICWADATVSIGTGKGILGDHGTPFERVVALGYQRTLLQDFFVRPEAGYFEDISGNGKSSGWVSTLLGIRALSSVGPELHLAVGPSYLQNPDQVLGGHFQFSLEGGLGIADNRTYVGLAWKHLSSAGIEMPNQGRDFIVVQFRILGI
jgi:hypothetical protein